MTSGMKIIPLTQKEWSEGAGTKDLLKAVVITKKLFYKTHK